MRAYACCANAPVFDNALGDGYPWVLFTFARVPRWTKERLWAWPYRVDSAFGQERIRRVRAYAVLSGNFRDNIALAGLDYPWILQSFSSTETLKTVHGVSVNPGTLVTKTGEVVDPGQGPEYKPRGILLDSGAFTVWTHGGEVNRDDLVQWAKDMRVHFGPEETRLINLDVIAGRKTDPAPSRAMVHESVVQSIENAQAIRAAGVPVVEVFHGREPLQELHEMLDRRQPGELIAIGGMGGLSMPQKRELCSRAFHAIIDRCGGLKGLVPVHGLGMSVDSPLAARFPWFSCDTTTWFTARNYNNHVDGSGRFVKRNVDTAPRTTHDMTQLFLRRRLNRWQRSERTLTDLWAARGVSFDL